jgi:hypothetical protein
MSEQKIDIKINTAANTSGAEKAEQSLDDLMAKMKALQSEGATSPQDASSQLAAQQQAEATASINRKVTAQVIAQAGQMAQQAAGQLREFSDELKKIDPDSAKNIEQVAKGFDLVSAASNGAALGASFGGAYGAAIGAVVGPALDIAMNEVKAAMMSAAEVERLEKVGEKLQVRMLSMKPLMDMRAEIESWKLLTQQIKDAAEAVKFDASIRKAQFAAAEAKAQGDVNIARATGGDVKSAEANLKNIQAARFENTQRDELAVVAMESQLSLQKLIEAENNLNVLKAKYYRADEDHKEKLRTQIAAEEKNVASLLEERIKAKQNEIKTPITQGFDRDVRSKDLQVGGIQESQGTAIDGVRGIIDNAKAKGGGGPELQAVLAEAEKMISDGVLSTSDLARLPVILSQFSGQLQNLGIFVQKLEDANRALDEYGRRLSAIEIAAKK